LGGNYFEDGGIINNLPLLFPAMEKCDFIFVLPLNSDFEETPNHRSVFNRLARVMEVRQGALERASLKDQYLFNELAELRKYAHALEQRLVEAKIDPPAVPVSEALNRALRERTHVPAKIFAICPKREFAESIIDTHELWKKKEAGDAFEHMREATRKEMSNLSFLHREEIGVIHVDSEGDGHWKGNLL
jgi:hypothetical protein